MGTIVTACMLVGILSMLPGLIFKRWPALPTWLAIPVSTLIFCAGAWNTFWHGLRHLNEFWGQAALVSGAFMMICALYMLRKDALPEWLKRMKVYVWLALTACFLTYAITIYRL